jgi:hypothetical protein
VATARFQLSLRVWHPAEDPGVLTALFERQPVTAWARGTPRIGPDGEALPGLHESTYWVAEIAAGPISTLDTTLRDLAGELLGSRAEIERLTDTGGRVECLVGWFEDGNSGVVLGHELLHRLADVGLDVAFDVYGSPRRS